MRSPTDADALVIVTEWNDFRALDLDRLERGDDGAASWSICATSTGADEVEAQRLRLRSVGRPASRRRFDRRGSSNEGFSSPAPPASSASISPGACSTEGHLVTGFDGMTPYYDVRLKQARLALLQRVTTASPTVAACWRISRALQHSVERARAGRHRPPRRAGRRALQPREPEPMSTSNLVGTFNVLELARAVQPKHLLLASTVSVYGGNTDVPFARERQDRLAAVALRRDQEGDRSDGALLCPSVRHPDHLLPLLHRLRPVGPAGHGAVQVRLPRSMQGEPIEIYGEGKMRRDFTYIDDLVEAHRPAHAGTPPERGQPVAGRRRRRFAVRQSRPGASSISAAASRCELMDFIAAHRDGARQAAEKQTCCRCRRATCAKPTPPRTSCGR